jgi:hypothetical protein
VNDTSILVRAVPILALRSIFTQGTSISKGLSSAAAV